MISGSVYVPNRPEAGYWIYREGERSTAPLYVGVSKSPSGYLVQGPSHGNEHSVIHSKRTGVFPYVPDVTHGDVVARQTDYGPLFRYEDYHCNVAWSADCNTGNLFVLYGYQRYQSFYGYRRNHMMTLYVYRAAGDGKYYVYLAQPILPYRIDATNGNAFERWLRTMGFNQLMYNCLGDPGRSPSPEYSEISAERINNTLTRIIDRFSDVGFPAWSYAQFTQYATENRYDLVPGAHIRTADFSSAFVFNEQMILEIGRPKLFGSLRNYWVDNLRSQAFVDACSSMPRLSDNSISNLQEILEFFSGVVKGEAPELPASLSDLWLGYRYSYSTTKMDVLEAIEFVKRCLDLKSLLPTVTCYGRASLTIDDIDVSCKCRVTVTPRRTAPLDEHYRLLSTLGLTPDLYYLWDSTPFSFIIDWFVPVGDVLAAVDASMLYNGQFYEFKDICYSLSYKRVTDAGPISCYSRWFEDSSPEICPLYWFESSGSVSAKQVLYRALDTNSLFLGGVQIGH